MAMIENILKTPTTIEVVFDAKMSNPNGDPDNETLLARTPRALVT